MFPAGQQVLRPAGKRLVTRQETAEDTDTAAQEQEASGKQQQGSRNDGFGNGADLGHDRSSDLRESGNESGHSGGSSL